MADWILDLTERMDGRYTFILTENILPPVLHTPQRSYENREAAVRAAEVLRDDLIGADTRSTTTLDFDPV